MSFHISGGYEFIVGVKRQTGEASTWPVPVWSMKDHASVLLAATSLFNCKNSDHNSLWDDKYHVAIVIEGKLIDA